jgi:hypothetical protein
MENYPRIFLATILIFESSSLSGPGSDPRLEERGSPAVRIKKRKRSRSSANDAAGKKATHSVQSFSSINYKF